ncbi:hypothetical protein [Staphylococcus sp. 17KM0847]|uniref:hypothetical protein n=1 Tax=Staphylococcus sp. 17KM0847 TaxID=2583989 RepID=UPI0015DBFAA1|nr:hypothetical protein [Staphylococcus sp. 17KM0847]QLK86310.1 hypothetical protein FGL66_06035 [Staphylococcus sp. 17KM0847]
MEKKVFKYKVEKQLWYLNKREKMHLQSILTNDTFDELQKTFKTPGRFVTHYLQNHVFKSRVVDTRHLFVSLFGLLMSNIILLGLFITGMLLSLSAVNYFLQPQVMLSTIVVIAALLGGIVLMFLALWMMKRTNAYFTKRLIDYKLNKVH